MFEYLDSTEPKCRSLILPAIGVNVVGLNPATIETAIAPPDGILLWLHELHQELAG